MAIRLSRKPHFTCKLPCGAHTLRASFFFDRKWAHTSEPRAVDIFQRPLGQGVHGGVASSPGVEPILPRGRQSYPALAHEVSLASLRVATQRAHPTDDSAVFQKPLLGTGDPSVEDRFPSCSHRVGDNTIIRVYD